MDYSHGSCSFIEEWPKGASSIHGLARGSSYRHKQCGYIGWISSWLRMLRACRLSSNLCTKEHLLFPAFAPTLPLCTMATLYQGKQVGVGVSEGSPVGLGTPMALGHLFLLSQTAVSEGQVEAGYQA